MNGTPTEWSDIALKIAELVASDAQTYYYVRLMDRPGTDLEMRDTYINYMANRVSQLLNEHKPREIG
jgi:hypothetical protein